MSRVRVAYVTAGFPFPLANGYLRHHHLLRALAARHDVRLRSLVGPDFDASAVDGVAGLVTDVQVFGPRRSGRTTRAARLMAPQWRPEVTRLRDAIAHDVMAGVDVVVLTGKDTAPVLDAVDGRVPVVVDLCDATSARLTQQLRRTGPVRRPGLLVRRRALRRIERELVDRGDVLLTASARDRDLLREEGAPTRVLRATVLPNGIDLTTWQRTPPTLGDAVVFCGNLGYRPNADAARHLVHDIMPEVWTRRPGAPVLVVGTGASPALVASLRHPRVTVVGAVPDVRPYLERAAVVAAPLHVATGIQNKLLEALAMELPVVTTTVAAAGLGPGAPLHVADHPRDAAAAIEARLAAVAGGAIAPHRRGRAWVAGRFDWDRSGRIMTDALHAALGTESVTW